MVEGNFLKFLSLCVMGEGISIIQGPQRQNVKSNMPIIVHNTDFLAIKMVLVHS